MGGRGFSEAAIGGKGPVSGEVEVVFWPAPVGSVFYFLSFFYVPAKKNI